MVILLLYLASVCLSNGQAVTLLSVIKMPKMSSESLKYGLQWDRVENKTSVAVYAGGAVVALWLSTTIVGAVNAVPLVRSPCSFAHGIMRMQILARFIPHFKAMSRFSSFVGCIEASSENSLLPKKSILSEATVHNKLLFVNMQLPKFLELVGLGYTSWFVYRYLLFKVSFSVSITPFLALSDSFHPNLLC